MDNKHPIYTFFSIFSICISAFLIFAMIFFVGQSNAFRDGARREYKDFETQQNNKLQTYKNEVSNCLSRVAILEEDRKPLEDLEDSEVIYPIDLPAGYKNNIYFYEPPVTPVVEEIVNVPHGTLEELDPEPKFGCPWGGQLEPIEGGLFIDPCWYPN